MKKFIRVLFLLINFVVFYTTAMEKQRSKLYSFFAIEQFQNLDKELKNIIIKEYGQWWYSLTTIENLTQVASIKFNHKSDKILIGTIDFSSEVKLFDLQGNLLGVFALDNITGSLNFTALDFQDQYLITAYKPYDLQNSIVKLFDLNSNSIKTLQIEGKILALAFNEQGQIVILTQLSQGDIVVKWYDINFNNIKEIKKECQNVCYYAKLNEQADKVLLQFNKNILLKKFKMESDIKYLGVEWDFNNEGSSNEISFTLQHKNFISSVEFAPQWDKALIGYSDGTAKLWNLDGGNFTTFWHIDNRYLESNFVEVNMVNLMQFCLPAIDIVGFSPNGSSILTVSSFCRSAKLWNLDGKNIVVFEHEEAIENVVFNCLGNMIMIGSFSKAKLWALYENPTLEQILLRKLIHIYLQTKKPSKKIQNSEILFREISKAFKLDKQELLDIWYSIPERVCNSFWKTIEKTISKFGK